ncbi:unnamed protein product [Acanthoscelides obtectus]|uniref:THAP-type domain-containing protein n=1 Tax=Acanthoscelides obtectus TaxID=200917 RepID=A0A9P0M194_ACAOB|nr:unnamed protein product [Acanthoscelides obtectus]CAK1650366.1 hypothetical protein AOBTE_LOCUS16746 [Acanthoscelides obtectus]
MVQQCYLCKIYKHQAGAKSLTFHSLPKNRERRKRWLSALGFVENHQFPKRVKLCSKHFGENAFVYGSEGQKTLKWDAIPLILCLILQILFIALIYLLFTGYSWMKRCITCVAHHMKSNMSILPQHYQHQKVIVLLKLLEYKNICLIRKKRKRILYPAHSTEFTKVFQLN